MQRMSAYGNDRPGNADEAPAEAPGRCDAQPPIDSPLAKVIAIGAYINGNFLAAKGDFIDRNISLAFVKVINIPENIQYFVTQR